MIKRESKATNKTSVNSVIGFGYHRKQMENAETFLETLGEKKKKKTSSIKLERVL